MASSPTFDIIRHKDPESTHIIRSHILHPHDDITIMCLVSAEKENVVSVLEDHLLESISSTSWAHGEKDADFTYITEKYNHFLKNIAQEDLFHTGALFAILSEDELTVSVIWSMCALLREKKGELSTIAENQENVTEFTSVSSGKIPSGSQIFLSSKSLTSFLWEDFFDECSHLWNSLFTETIQGILLRDAHDSIDLIHISFTADNIKKSHISSSRKVNHQIDIARWFLLQAQDSLRHNRTIEVFLEKIRIFIGTRNTQILILFLLIGAILFFGLISMLLWALFHATNTPQIDIKNQILQAQTLIEESQKLTSNSEAFNKNIHAAENILFKIRDRQEYMKDTQSLLQRIEAMKKEMYDIQTIDLKKRTSIIKFNPLDMSPIGVFESNNKLNLIGKSSSLLGYIKWSPLPSISSYPPGEEVISADITDDGNFYFLTKNMRVLSTKRNEITYVNVTGQESWENASRIKTFNNNIYLIDTAWWQLYKHKPGVNGFSQKSGILAMSLSGIVDIGIDGGFYILTDEPKIYRMIPKDGFTQSGIILNKVPGEYILGKNEGETHVIVKQNLNFIYILNGNRIWIFEPDSKRFQDIRSWTYIAQLEISTNENIRNISVPRDGLIYIVTNLWVYELPFEFVDKNIILKN